MGKRNIVFLLGGRDLEMLTIKEILDRAGKEQVSYVDKGLSWGAKLSAYADELKSFKDSEIYGIELERDLPMGQIPDHYHSIDHHGEFESKDSSLEQVLQVLKEVGVDVPMTDDLKRIAANDKGYIAGLNQAGAKFDQILDIRRRDLDAQGVTEDDRKMAVDSVNQKEVIEKDGCRLIVVEALTDRFSAIVDTLLLDVEAKSDRLKEMDRILVYSDTDFCYYGKDRDGWLTAVRKAFGLSVKQIYKGGGDEGYFSFHYTPEKKGDSGVPDMVQFVKDLFQVSTVPTPHSKHVFLFPFNWSEDDDSATPLGRLTPNDKIGNWERCRLPKVDKVSDEDLYNERNFFYPFVYNTLYDTEGSSPNLWHFERTETDGTNFKVKYVITKKDGLDFKRYTLYVRFMNLNFYSTGVGILSIFADNYDYPDREDVISINQYGRRIFHPFYADVHEHRETALSLAIEGLNGGTVGGELDVPTKHNQPTSFIRNLIADAVTPLEADAISPVLDDRMFVMSWYRTTWQDNSFGEDFKGLLNAPDAFLYRYVYVDGLYPTCQDKKLREKQLKDSLYTRWFDYGTIYGATRYSFVMLTTPDCPDFLLQYFETIYLRLVELALIQRASILRFSRVLSRQELKKGADTTAQFRDWYGAYIEFLNKFRFPEASAQEQGIELYDILCEKMRIKENADYLDNQFNERQEYLELQETSLLGKFATLAVPVSIVSACFGFFFHDPLDKALFSFDKLHWSYWLLPGSLALLASALLTFIIYFCLFRRKRHPFNLKCKKKQ